jgi:hypothetical protein
MSTINEQPKKNENKFLKFLWRHKLNAFLVAAILVILAWSWYSTNKLENTYAAEKQELITNYEIKLDSLNADRLLLTAKTFSWAIRSELLRDNLDQVNQYFNEFVKNPDVTGLQLINPENGFIEIATDKNLEGTTNSSYNNIDDQFVKKDSMNIKLVTPISGLNKKIAVLVMDVKNTAVTK